MESGPEIHALVDSPPLGSALAAEAKAQAAAAAKIKCLIPILKALSIVRDVAPTIESEPGSVAKGQCGTVCEAIE